MNLEQTISDLKRLKPINNSKISDMKKILLGIVLTLAFGIVCWIVVDYMGKLVVTMAIIPIIGFIFIYGFWGYLLANFGSFVALLIALYSNYRWDAIGIFSFTEILYILVLVIVAALISEQKGLIQKLFKQIRIQQSEENRLIDSRDDYRNLVYRIPVGLYRTTPEGKILEASSTLVDILGYPDFETLSFVNIGIELYVDPQDRENEQKLLSRDGIVQDYELRLYRRNKDIIWVRDNVRAIQDDEGEIICYEGSLENITERKQIEQAEQEQRMLAEALRDTAAALSGTLEFEEVLDRILQNMEHVVPHDAANIMLFENGFARIARTKGYISDWDEDARQTSRFLIDDIPTLSHMHKTGEPLAIADTHESELWVNLPHSEWMRSYAGAPIRVKGKLIGFLNLNSAAQGFFDDSKARWLQAFADQAGLAIENARMFGEIHEHARQTALINSITQTTIMAPDIDGMIQVLVDRLGELLSSDGAYITLWDENQNQAKPGAAYGPLRDRYLEIKLQPNENTLTSMVLAEKKPRIFHEGDFSDEQLEKIVDNCESKSILGVPLIADGRKLGAILVSFVDHHEFLDEEILLSEQAARIISLAIYKAKLFESEKEKTDELTRANSVITALGKTATKVESVKNFDRMVGVLGEELILLGLQSMVLLQSANDDKLKIHHASPLDNLQTGYSIEPWFDLLGSHIAAEDFSYYNDVINKKRTFFFEDLDEMMVNAFPILDHYDSQEFISADITCSENKGYLLPLVPGKNVIGCLFVWGSDIDALDLPAYSLFASQIAVAFENARLLEKIQQIAITDELTGLYNRRGLFEIGRLEIERTRRYNQPLSAIVMDIDHFKRVNDRYSHAVGDQVLRSFAQCIHENTRELDVVGRIGGEEFVLLLPGSNHLSAHKTAARLQKLIAENVTQTGFGEIRITMSQGVAELDASMIDLNDLVQAADRALYQAKETGRNRVVSSSKI